MYDGWIPVGIWHTHPGYVGTGTPDGVENGSHVSADDITYTNGTGLTMYVAEHNATSPDDRIGSTRWYSREPNSKDDSKPELVGKGVAR